MNDDTSTVHGQDGPARILAASQDFASCPWSVARRWMRIQQSGRSYGGSVGVDVHHWPGVDVLVGDAAKLPFTDDAFDTVTILAALNHIPNREAALREVGRVLRQDGRLIVTMIGPLTGRVAHTFRRANISSGSKPKGFSSTLSRTN